MGIVIKQTLKGSIWSYIGVVIGALNVAILMPRFFSEEQVGLTTILVSFSVIFSQFSMLGIGGVTSYFFPLFRDPQNNHNGYLALISIISIVGFVVFSFIFLVFQDVILFSKTDSHLLNQYSFYILPLTFFTMMFSILDGYNTVLFDSVTGTFFKEFLFRILNTLIILLYYFDAVSFSVFLFLYIFILCLPAILIFFYLLKQKQVFFRNVDFSLFKKYRKEIFNVALFSFVSGLGSILTVYVDKFFTNYYLGLALTGVYSISFFVATLIQIPSRSMSKILIPLIAQSWRNNIHDKLQLIYTNSSLAQFLIASFIFLMVWLNVDIIFLILPPQYSAGKYVILIVGLANIIDAIGGSGSAILQISDSYKFSTYFIFILMILTVILDVILIPFLGIIGASLGALFAALGNVFLRIVFLKRKYDLSIFDTKHIWSFIIFLFCLLVFGAFDFSKQIILNGVIKSLIIVLIYVFFLFRTNLLVDKEFIKRIF